MCQQLMIWRKGDILGHAPPLLWDSWSMNWVSIELLLQFLRSRRHTDTRTQAQNTGSFLIMSKSASHLHIYKLGKSSVLSGFFQSKEERKFARGQQDASPSSLMRTPSLICSDLHGRPPTGFSRVRVLLWKLRAGTCRSAQRVFTTWGKWNLPI